MMKHFVLIAVLPCYFSVTAQMPEVFYFGNDLSYVNQMEDCGADFKEDGVPKDVYQIYADHGNNLVRLRLWVDPDWQNDLPQPDGVLPQYSDLADVWEAIERTKAAGMQVLLDFHYSDVWADPGRQVLPSRWAGVAFDTDALADSVYNYTFNILNNLNDAGLMPEMVQIGNETNSGMMRHASMDDDFDPENLISDSWTRHAQLYNAGIQAVRDVAAMSTINTKVALHYAGVGSGLTWWYGNIISSGVTDFDVIGFSYYYAWHGSSIPAVGNTIQSLRTTYPDKEIVILETGYPWTNLSDDGLGNIIRDTYSPYSPPTPTVQLEYMVDLTKEVMASGGNGVVFWESAWVSTPCRTPWGTGSSHEHVAFFSFDNYNFIGNGGGLWMHPEFYADLSSKRVTFKVDMSEADAPEGAFITGDFTGETNWPILKMYHEGNGIYSYTTYLAPESEGAYYFLNGNDFSDRETVPEPCIAWFDSDRGYEVGTENVTFSSAWEGCEVEVPTGLGADKSAAIYPNPAENELFIEHPGEKILSIKIIDLTGKTCLDVDQVKTIDGNTVKLDVSCLQGGVYFVQINSVRTIQVRKILIR